MSDHSLFNDIAQGLREAIAYERKECAASTVQLTKSFSAPPHWSPDEIRQLRLKYAMTQRVFADFMGVSPKTVEAWECGRNHPNGSASRLMQVISQNDSFLAAP